MIEEIADRQMQGKFVNIASDGILKQRSCVSHFQDAQSWKMIRLPEEPIKTMISITKAV